MWTCRFDWNGRGTISVCTSGEKSHTKGIWRRKATMNKGGSLGRRTPMVSRGVTGRQCELVIADVWEDLQFCPPLPLPSPGQHNNNKSTCRFIPPSLPLPSLYTPTDPHLCFSCLYLSNPHISSSLFVHVLVYLNVYKVFDRNFAGKYINLNLIFLSCLFKNFMFFS